MTPSVQAAPRLKPSARRVYELLHAANYGWVRGAALMEAGGSRFGARLNELKELGFPHDTRPDPTSSMPFYRFTPPTEPRQLTLEDVA